MHKVTEKIYTFSLQFIRSFSLFLTIILFLGGMLFTCYSTDMDSQLVLTRWDNPLWNLFWTALSVALLLLTSNLFNRHRATHGIKAKSGSILTGAVLLWCLIVGGALVLFGRTVPAADAMSVYRAAKELADGNTSIIHPTASYLSYYPQQIGLLAFFEALIRLWRLFPWSIEAYHFIKCLYVFLACAIILFQREIVKILWQDPRAEQIYLLLAGANLPFLMYTSFVYGEIPSFAAVSAGIYFLLKLLCRRFSDFRQDILSGAAAVFFLTLSVMLRKNNLILILAVLIVVLLQWLKSRRHLLAVFALVCALCCFQGPSLVQKGYELRAGNTLSPGVPAISYLAMGMQESSCGNGWYNGFNFNTYWETGMDTAKTTEISRQAIQERLSYFREHPGYAADFYFHKHLSQWADGTYASRQATLATFGGRNSLFISLYEGPLSSIFIGYANIFQNVLYLGVLLFCIAACRWSAENSIPHWLMLIGVIGGFLFHIIWEANSRYIFLYSLLLMPYCARGLSILAHKARQRNTAMPKKETRSLSDTDTAAAP